MKLILEDTRPRRPRFEKDKGRKGEKMKGYRERDRERQREQSWVLAALDSESNLHGCRKRGSSRGIWHWDIIDPRSLWASHSRDLQTSLFILVLVLPSP